MHPNPIFHDRGDRENLNFARERGFGVLAVSAKNAPLISHVPFRLSDDGREADLHLMRSNPIVRALGQPSPAVLAVSGPDGYVSPDWYGIADQVPTWNYVAVHLRGPLELRPQEELRGLLDRLSAEFETRLAPKPAWATARVDDDTLARLMRMIVPCRMRVETVQGTWKLTQNKPDAVRDRAANHVAGFGIGAETGILAALMRGAGDV